MLKENVDKYQSSLKGFPDNYPRIPWKDLFAARVNEQNQKSQ